MVVNRGIRSLDHPLTFRNEHPHVRHCYDSNAWNFRKEQSNLVLGSHQHSLRFFHLRWSLLGEEDWKEEALSLVHVLFFVLISLGFMVTEKTSSASQRVLHSKLKTSNVRISTKKNVCSSFLVRCCIKWPESRDGTSSVSLLLFQHQQSCNMAIDEQ